MKEINARVVVRILDKDYQVACPPEEKDALLAAAQELDKRMRKVRNSGALIGADRMAVMVALNLCHELQQIQKHIKQSSTTEVEQALTRMSTKLNDALTS